MAATVFSGNIQPKEAESIVEHVEKVFYKGSQPLSQALFASQHYTNRVVKLDRGVYHFYSAEGLNPSDENSSLLHYIQVHASNFYVGQEFFPFATVLYKSLWEG